MLKAQIRAILAFFVLVVARFRVTLTTAGRIAGSNITNG